MQVEDSLASTSGTAYFDFDIPGAGPAQGTFDFSNTSLSTSNMGLTFLPQDPPRRGNKRSRSIADVDGDHSCIQKKKRRLRLFLITSRLSPQFSHPATNIVDRGSSKIAVWAKQKALGRNLLRKAAILNRIRRTTDSPKAIHVRREVVQMDQEKELEQFELAKLEFQHGAIDTYTRPVLFRTPSVPPSAAVRTGGHFVVSGSPSSSPNSSRSSSPTPSSPPPDAATAPISDYRSPNEAYAYSPPRAQIPRRDYVPLPPSPLGFNYDALDVEEDVHDSFHYDDEEELIPNRYDDYDEDESSFSPSTITNNSSTTAQISTMQALEIPSSTHHPDFSLLDLIPTRHSMFGDYDQADEDAESIWPSTFAKQAAAAAAAASTANTDASSTSPDLPAVLATSGSPSKRTDSFATPRSSSISPNFPPSTVSTAPASPNFTATAHSPNFAPSDAPLSTKAKYKGPQEMGREDEMSQERKRQRDLLFGKFGP